MLNYYRPGRRMRYRTYCRGHLNVPYNIVEAILVAELLQKLLLINSRDAVGDAAGKFVGDRSGQAR